MLAVTLLVSPETFYGARAVKRPAGPSEIQFQELVMRSRATYRVMPEYPPQSVKLAHSGVAVGQVTVDHAGRVSKVSILQSPDKMIGKAVAEALRNWRFKPETIHNVPVDVTGQITFDFVIRDGKGLVVNANQTPQHQ